MCKFNKLGFRTNMNKVQLKIFLDNWNLPQIYSQLQSNLINYIREENNRTAEKQERIKTVSFKKERSVSSWVNNDI